MEKKLWFQNSYRRNLIDMHIPDWHESFFSRFNAADYIEHLAHAHVDTAYIYANSCVGLCNWPTKTGQMHRGLKGRDILKELTSGCREKNMNVVVYINIWSKWAYENYPGWRVVSQDGRGTLEYQWNSPGRYGVCCFNSPYKDYVLALVRELCHGYDFDGLWVDMILWRSMCYCGHCKEKFFNETGYEIPATVNWGDPVWHTFIRKREEWNEAFYESIRSLALSIKPHLSISCNSSYYPKYLMGESLKYFRMSDYIGGDFESDRLSHSFECKFYNSVTKHKPFEFLNSVMEPNLREHTIMKSKEKLKILLCSTLMNNGRYGFIDAIDPAGTLDDHVYQVMRDIMAEEMKYEKYLSHDVSFCCDVGIYTNLESMIDPGDNGQRVVHAESHAPHMDAAKNTALTFIREHVPFGILTKYDLQNLNQYKVIVAPHLYALDDQEIEALRSYVGEGGNLYASGPAGLFTAWGKRDQPCALSELLGVSFVGTTKEAITYIRPDEKHKGVLLHYTEDHPITLYCSQTLVKAQEETEVLGWLTLPYTDPKDPEKFAAATSNPPGRHTAYPSIVQNSFGKGQVIYTAGSIEAMACDDQRKLFMNLINRLSKNDYVFASDAPGCVELTMYRQKAENRYVLNVLNFQSDLPNIPIFNVTVRIKFETTPKKLYDVPDEKEIAYDFVNGYIDFKIERLDIFAMYIIEY